MAIEAVDPRARGLRNRPFDDAVGPRRARAPARLGAARRRRRRRSRTASGRSAASRATTRAAARPRARRIYAVAGALLMIAAMLIDPAALPPLLAAIYIGLCGGDGLVLVFGAATRGSKRWIDIGFFTFQPSEFGKVLLALALAGFLADRAKQISRLSVAAAGDRARSGARRPRVPPARRGHGARLHRACSRRCCSSPAFAGCTWR